MKTYWTHIDDDTEVRYEAPEEAAQYAIEQMEPEPGDEHSEVTVFEVARKKISDYHLDCLKNLIVNETNDYLITKYGNPDSEEPVHPVVKAALTVFIDAIKNHWPVLICTPTGNKVTKTVKEWLEVLE